MTASRTITVLDQQADGETLKLLLLLVNGQTIGSCQIAGWDEPEPSILGITIDPAQQRRGHATALIHHAIELAKLHRKIKLTLTVEKQNSPAIALYSRLGFVTEFEDPLQLWMSMPIE
jgi:ribosomal protein S18 acetylase RimI-like enzyme